MDANLLQPEASILIEDTETALAFSYLFLQQAANTPVLSLDALTGFTPRAPSENAKRLHVFSSWLPESEKPKAAAYLRTVEDLRNAFLTSHEDVEFCFSELAQTPKNVFLRSVAHQYLDSSLNTDRAEALWGLIDAIKTGTLEHPLPTHITAIRTHEASYGYDELLQVLSTANGVDTLQILSPVDFYKEEGKRRPLTIVGNAPRALSRLSDSIVRSNAPRAISFFGSPVQAQFLKHRVRVGGKSCDFLLSQESAIATQAADDVTLQLIRQDRGRPLKERLELGQTLLQTNRPRQQAIVLEGGAKTKAVDVALLPYFPYPASVLGPVSYFVDPNQLNLSTKHPLLDRHELNLLKSAGFSIPTQEDRQLAHAEYTRLIAGPTRARHRFFTTSHLGALRARRLLAPPVESSPQRRYAVPFAAKHFSASQLESYARCPAQYLVGNRLRLDSGTGDFDSAFPLLFGSAIHQALELYKKGSAEGLEVLDACLSQTLGTEAFISLSTAERFLIAETARPFFVRFLETESILKDKFKSVKPLCLEQAFEIEVDGISVRGKIDRVDETADGRLLVMDYKTGTVSFSPNHVAAGTNFQALIYLLGAETHFKKPIAGVLFTDLKKGELRRGLMRAEGTLTETVKSMTRGHVLPQEKLNALIDAGVSKLKEEVEHIRGGDFAPVPDPQHCTTCRLFGHCRAGDGYV